MTARSLKPGRDPCAYLRRRQVYEIRRDFDRPSINHVQRYVENDGKADIGYPPMPVEQAGNEVCGQPHQCDGQHQAKYKNARMFARSTGDCQHVVERHGDIGDDDLRCSLNECLSGSVRLVWDFLAAVA